MSFGVSIDFVMVIAYRVPDLFFQIEDSSKPVLGYISC
jgi:hypothetical protein